LKKKCRKGPICLQLTCQSKIFVVEIKGNEEIDDPAPENIKKFEYATEHFERLNSWLKDAGNPTRYRFNMVSPKSYNIFFQKLREESLSGFRSELDVVLSKAVKSSRVQTH
jgi:type III restriction enzyme